MPELSDPRCGGARNALTLMTAAIVCVAACIAWRALEGARDTTAPLERVPGGAFTSARTESVVGGPVRSGVETPEEAGRRADSILKAEPLSVAQNSPHDLADVLFDPQDEILLTGPDVVRLPAVAAGELPDPRQRSLEPPEILFFDTGRLQPDAAPLAGPDTGASAGLEFVPPAAQMLAQEIAPEEMFEDTTVVESAEQWISAGTTIAQRQPIPHRQVAGIASMSAFSDEPVDVVAIPNVPEVQESEFRAPSGESAVSERTAATDVQSNDVNLFPVSVAEITADSLADSQSGDELFPDAPAPAVDPAVTEMDRPRFPVPPVPLSVSPAAISEPAEMGMAIDESSERRLVQSEEAWDQPEHGGQPRVSEMQDLVPFDDQESEKSAIVASADVEASPKLSPELITGPIEQGVAAGLFDGDEESSSAESDSFQTGDSESVDDQSGLSVPLLAERAGVTDDHRDHESVLDTARRVLSSRSLVDNYQDMITSQEFVLPDKSQRRQVPVPSLDRGRIRRQGATPSVSDRAGAGVRVAEKSRTLAAKPVVAKSAAMEKTVRPTTGAASKPSVNLPPQIDEFPGLAERPVQPPADGIVGDRAGATSQTLWPQKVLVNATTAMKSLMEDIPRPHLRVPEFQLPQFERQQGMPSGKLMSGLLAPMTRFGRRGTDRRQVDSDSKNLTSVTDHDSETKVADVSRSMKNSAAETPGLSVPVEKTSVPQSVNEETAESPVVQSSSFEKTPQVKKVQDLSMPERIEAVAATDSPSETDQRLSHASPESPATDAGSMKSAARDTHRNSGPVSSPLRIAAPYRARSRVEIPTTVLRDTLPQPGLKTAATAERRPDRVPNKSAVAAAGGVTDRPVALHVPGVADEPAEESVGQILLAVESQQPDNANWEKISAEERAITGPGWRARTQQPTAGIVTPPMWAPQSLSTDANRIVAVPDRPMTPVPAVPEQQLRKVPPALSVLPAATGSFGAVTDEEPVLVREQLLVPEQSPAAGRLERPVAAPHAVAPSVTLERATVLFHSDPSSVIYEPQPMVSPASDPRRGRGLLHGMTTELGNSVWMERLTESLKIPREQFSTGLHRVSSSIRYAGRATLD